MTKHDHKATSKSLASDLTRGPLGGGAQSVLLRAACDLSLLLSPDGTIIDLNVDDADLMVEGAPGWLGQKLVDLVTIESKPKIAELLADAASGRPPRWRQVNHPTANGDVPIRYACVASGDNLLAIGRDMKATAAVQQRLLQTQQSLERDYLRLRQAESRYRLMFDLSEEAVVIVDAANRRIEEANPAAHKLLGLAAGTLPRQPASMLVMPGAREDLISLLGASAARGEAGGRLALRNGMETAIVATPFRQDRATFLLLRLSADRQSAAEPAQDALRQAVEQMPDAFVLTDQQLRIVAANAAFIELAQAVSAEAVTGELLGRWLGRPNLDLELIATELRKAGTIRNVPTIIRGGIGAQEEVELSAVMVEADGIPHAGFVIRVVARRLRDLPPVDKDLPRSVEQLTGLVGRMSLRDIVRESSDLIERLCIEAALSYTADNRASAAEVLGLSRQGLYSKLHRHGLGNLVDGQN